MIFLSFTGTDLRRWHLDNKYRFLWQYEDDL